MYQNLSSKFEFMTYFNVEKTDLKSPFTYFITKTEDVIRMF